MSFTSKIFITGTGSLSRSIFSSLTSIFESDIEVYIASRFFENSEWQSIIGNARSKILGKNLNYIPVEIDWNSITMIAEVLRQIQPTIIIHTASLQSMWQLESKNQWSSLVKKHGYGLTVLFQWHLASKISEGLKQSGVQSKLINCCYPDVVNYILAIQNNPVFSGIGNIGIVEALLKVLQKHTTNIKIIAQHYNINCILNNKRNAVFPRVWIDNNEIIPSKKLFNTIKYQATSDINMVTSCTLLPIIKSLIEKIPLECHLPGPNGMIGGYPVKIIANEIQNDFEDFISLDDALAWNKKMLYLEGVKIDDNYIKYSAKATSAIAKYSKEVAEGFSVDSIDESFSLINEMRQYLMQK